MPPAAPPGIKKGRSTLFTLEVILVLWLWHLLVNSLPGNGGANPVRYIVSPAVTVTLTIKLNSRP
jgi:hypothetical protein